MARILVIDDNPDNMELMTYLLRAAGHQTLRAADGIAGLEAATGQSADQPVDLIVCDSHLPGMDGSAVVRRLKADPERSAIPVLVATASRGGDDVARLLADGFDGFIAKPIVPADFLRRIEQFLPAMA
ncbi:response regulator [Azospirillum agricola]|uniref:response regulator n=1 Tax=Azospirillum agricola TaxID=1720247 RepID=UPI000A0EFAFF|nr:response regulator [Azospirillum agricola]SMH46607.1 Response regulator receiver domain-containing protein [Azospirillum lipoferum]